MEKREDFFKRTPSRSEHEIRLVELRKNYPAWNMT